MRKAWVVYLFFAQAKEKKKYGGFAVEKSSRS